MNLPRLAVLISGSGRNLQAILDACAQGSIGAKPVLVISNRADAYGLVRARDAGIPTLTINHRDYASREDFDCALGDALDAVQPDIVVLAGFMRILTGGFIRRFQGRMLNIHPSLLPKYKGLDTHKRALEAGDEWHGASVHYVTEELDAGAVVKQGRIRVQPGDTPDGLAERVMRDIELKLFPEVVSWAASGRLRYNDGQALLDNQPLETPLIGDY